MLVLVAEGLSNQGIATTLLLSFQTVKSYVRQMFNTLNITNRVHAANYVIGTVGHDQRTGAALELSGRLRPEWRRDGQIPSAVL